MNNKKLAVFIAFVCLASAVFSVSCASTFAHNAIDRYNPEEGNTVAANPALGTYEGLIEMSAPGKEWWLNQEKEEWYVTSFDNLKLYAEYLPNPENRGTVILMHGYHGSGGTDFGAVIPELYSRGFSILAPHQRAHGKSEGQYISYGVNESRDVVSWCTELNAKVPADKPVILFGVSMGAGTVLMSAGRGLPENVKGIFADCGFTSTAEILAAVGNKVYHIDDPNLVADVCIAIYKIAGYDPFYSTEDALANNRIPVVIVHGEADNFVPYEMGKKNAGYAKNMLVGFYSFPDAGHAMAIVRDKEKYIEAFEALLSAAQL